MSAAMVSFARARNARLARGPIEGASDCGAAWRYFETLGLPQRGSEAWKYTPTEALWNRSYVSAPRAPTSSVELSPPLPGAARVVLLNGLYEARLSDDSPFVHRKIHPCASFEPRQSSLLALNQSLFEEAVLIELGPGVDGGTIEVLHRMEAAPDEAMVHPRILVKLGEGAQLTLLETFEAQRSGAYLVNASTEASLGPGATLNHFTVQTEGPRATHLGALTVHQQARSRFHSHLLQLGAALSRREQWLRLEGSGAEARSTGLFLPRAQQHHEQHLRLEHLAPGCTSRQLFSGIARDQGRGVFTGQVVIHPGAQQSDCSQSARALLLSPAAEVNLRPHLEIHADEVKATHGVTVGELEPEQIFYLRSRGIAEADARELLLMAFAQRVLEPIHHEGLREREVALVTQQLAELRADG